RRRLQRVLRYQSARVRGRDRHRGQLPESRHLESALWSDLRAPEAHIAVDECGAPGFFSGGAQLALLPGEHGRLEAATFRAALGAYPPGDVHKVQPAA